MGNAGILEEVAIMTSKILSVGTALLLIGATACSSAQQRNTAIGAGLGAAVGAVIGSDSGHPVEGAVIGGAAGAAIGYGVTKD
jgi:hypothetical protein